MSDVLFDMNGFGIYGFLCDVSSAGIVSCGLVFVLVVIVCTFSTSLSSSSLELSLGVVDLFILGIFPHWL